MDLQDPSTDCMMGHPSSTGVLLTELNSKMVIPMKWKKGLGFSKVHDDPPHLKPSGFARLGIPIFQWKTTLTVNVFEKENKRKVERIIGWLNPQKVLRYKRIDERIMTRNVLRWLGSN